MKIIHTDKSPKAIGPYSQAILSGNMLFCSGQIGLTAEGEMKGPGIEGETHQVLENLKNIVETAGMTLRNVTKTTIYLTDLSHFPIVNEIYGTFFGEHKPARATVQVAGLPKGALIEIDLIAVL